MKKILFGIFSLFFVIAQAAAPIIWLDSDYGGFLVNNGFKLLDNKEFRTISVDPSAGAGVAAEIGSIAVRNNSGLGEGWFKVGAGNTAWSNFLTGSTGWGVTGNGGTTVGTNFLGTTDDEDLVFKTNSTEVVRVTSGSNSVGIQTSTPDGALHVKPSATGTVMPPNTFTGTPIAQVNLTSGTAAATKIPEPIAPVFGSTAQNLGSGGFLANGQTIDYEIYGAETVGGSEYVGTLVATGSFSDSINDGTTPFGVDVTFTPAVGPDNYYYRRNEAGAGWSDFVNAGISGSFTDSNQPGSTIPAFSTIAFTANGTTHYVRTTNFGTSPGGTTYFAPSFSLGSYVDDNDGSLFVIQWNVTGGSNANYKNVGADNQTSFNRSVTGTSFTEIAGYWATQSSDVTVTPFNYGYQAGTADFPRTYTLRNSKLFFGTDYYSPSVAVVVADPGGSGYHSIDLDWINGVHTTGFKVLRDSNPLGASGFELGSNLTTQQDDKITAWNESSTITPTSLPANAVIVEKTNTLSTDPPFIELRSGSGATRHGTIAITDSAGANLAQTAYSSSTGAFNIDTLGERVDLSTIGGTRFAEFSSTSNILNDQGAATGTTSIKASGVTPFVVNHSNGSVSLGNNVSSTAASVVVQANTSSEKALHVRKNGTSTANLTEWTDSAGFALGLVDSTGRSFWSAGSAASPSISFQGDTDTGFSASGNSLTMSSGGAGKARLTSAGLYVGADVTPTAKLHLAAGTTSITTAPIKTTSGPLMTSPEVGAWEHLTDKLYFTITTGAARKEFALNDIALTSGRVPFVTTNGRLTDSSAFTFSAGTLTATGFVGALTGNASTATALASNPTDCGIGSKAISIDASGNLTCSSVSLTADVSGNLAVSHLNSGTGASSTTFWRGDGTWATPLSGGSGDVNGPASSTDNAIARFDLATGKLIQNSTMILEDAGTISASGYTAGVLHSNGSGAITSSPVVTADITDANITNAKLADMVQATFKGRAVTAGTGVPTDLTATQATAILNNFVGDTGSGGTKGLVPAPSGGDAGKVLFGDGTWKDMPFGTDTVFFRGYVAASISPGDTNTVEFDAGTNTDPQSGWSGGANDYYVIPEDGYYVLGFNGWQTGALNSYAGVELWVNGSNVYGSLPWGETPQEATTFGRANNPVAARQFTAGDTVGLKWDVNGSPSVQNREFYIARIAGSVVGAIATTNSVNTNSESAEINCDASSSVTSGAWWLSSVGNRSGTACQVNITAAKFSSAPYACHFTIKDTTPAATSVVITSDTIITVYGPNADYDGYLTCTGPR